MLLMGQVTPAVESASADLQRAFEGEGDDDALAAVLTAAFDAREAWASEGDHAVEMAGVDGAPDWYPPETEAFQFATAVRDGLRDRYPKGPLPDVVQSALEAVVGRTALGKGRKEYVDIAATCGKAPVAERLARYLDDPEVAGPVLAALRKAKVGGHEAKAEELASSGQGSSVRSEAKNYLKARAAQT